MRVLVCGDREWSNIQYIREALTLFNDCYGITCIIEGDCRGADKIAGIWADDVGIEHEKYPAQWDKYGKAAGPIRNKQMLDEGKPDFVLAFHENIDKSVGTKNMLLQARNRKIQTMLDIGENNVEELS